MITYTPVKDAAGEISLYDIHVDGVWIGSRRTMAQCQQAVANLTPMAPSITCPRCQRVSYNPNDIRERFCGVCGFHEERPL